MDKRTLEQGAGAQFSSVRPPGKWNWKGTDGPGGAPRKVEKNLKEESSFLFRQQRHSTDTESTPLLLFRRRTATHTQRDRQSHRDREKGKLSSGKKATEENKCAVHLVRLRHYNEDGKDANTMSAAAEEDRHEAVRKQLFLFLSAHTEEGAVTHE